MNVYFYDDAPSFYHLYDIVRKDPISKGPNQPNPLKQPPIGEPVMQDPPTDWPGKRLLVTSIYHLH